MNCGKKEEFVSHYLFDNGILCDPEKLRVRRTEAGKFFKKTSKGFCYRSKEIRSLCGTAVTNLSNIESVNAFVLVPAHENFINCPYQEAFDEIVSKHKESKKKLAEREQKQRSKSAPAVASFCGDSIVTVKSVIEKEESRKSACGNKSKVTLKSEKGSVRSSCKPSSSSLRSKCKIPESSPSSDDSADDKCGRNKSAVRKSSLCKKKSTSSRGSNVVSPPHRHCVSADKYACCDQDSDDNDVEVVAEEVETKTSKKSRASRNEVKAKRPAKKGFFATCCSCCVKKPRAVPCSDNIRPSSSSNPCNNAKTTQTSPEDFKRAIKCLKMSIQQEKRRLKMYRRNQRKKVDKFECVRDEPKMCIDGVEVKPSARELEKKEAEYKKIRAKYSERRKKMEQKINKALAKEEKLRPKC